MSNVNIFDQSLIVMRGLVKNVYVLYFFDYINNKNVIMIDWFCYTV